MQLDFLQEESPAQVRKSATPKKAATMTANAVKSIPDPADEKAAGAFKTISEAADFLGVPQHVLRFWEGRFKQIKPLKLRGGRRYYRPEDMEILATIKNLLYKQGYTIKGAKKAFAASTQAAPEEPVETKPAATDAKQKQLTAIRQELIGLRDALKPHVF